MRDVKDWDESVNFEKRSFKNGIYRVINDSKNLAQKKDSLSPEIYEKRVSRFTKDYEDFLKNDFLDKDCKRLMKRLRKHGNDLWTFLREPVPCHNNSAELAIRRAVVNRKVSNGNRSELGAEVQEILLSVIQTARLHGKSLMETLLNGQMLSFDSA